jgi:hypothetical protein
MNKKNVSILLTLLLGTFIPSLHASLDGEENSDRGTKRLPLSDLLASPVKRVDHSKKEIGKSSDEKQDASDQKEIIEILSPSPLSRSPHLLPSESVLAFDVAPQELIPFTEMMNNLPQGTVAPMPELLVLREEERVSRNRFEGLLTDISEIAFNENLQTGSSIFTKFIRALETGYLYYKDSYWMLDETMWNIDARLSVLRKISALARNFHSEAIELNLKTDALKKLREEAFAQSRDEEYERILLEEKALISSRDLFKKTHAEILSKQTEQTPYHSLGLINKKQFQDAKLTQNKEEILNTISYLYIRPFKGMIPFDFKRTLMESLKDNMIKPGSLPQQDSRTHHQGSFVDPISGRLLKLDVKVDYEEEDDNERRHMILLELMNDAIHWSVNLEESTDVAFSYSMHLNDTLNTRLGQLTVSLS